MDDAGQVKTALKGASPDKIAAKETTLDEIRGLALIEVFSTTEPNLAGLTGDGRAATYAAVKNGAWPVHRSGRRVRVLVPALLKLLDGEA